MAAGLGGAPKKVLDALARLIGKPSIITFHSLGDLDACASALALAEYLGSGAVVATPDRVNSESKRILKDELARFELFAQAHDRLHGAKIILLDCNDMSLLGHLKGITPHILIDHHAKQKGSVSAEFEWVEPEASSTCELVAQAIGKPNARQADLLIYGMLSDSAKLAHAEPKTFGVLAGLLEHASQDYGEFLFRLEKPESPPDRAAVLSGLRNATWKEEGGLICSVASVASHEAHVAEALVRAGADCAFAGASGKDCRISARMRPELASRVDLPELMMQVGILIGGRGGGHAAAAGATGGESDALDEALIFAQREFFAQAGRL